MIINARLTDLIADTLPTLSAQAQDECAREPIHVPGAIQPHGALLAIRPSDMRVVQASANLEQIFGLAAPASLGRTAMEVFGAAAWERIMTGFQSMVPNQAGATPRLPLYNGPPNGPLSATHDGQRHDSGRSGTVTVTTTRATSGHICVELEPSPDERNSSSPSSATGLVPKVQAMIAAVRSARTIIDLSSIAVTELRTLTGHSRALVYRFGPELNGQVIAEDRKPELQSYLGLHYPASDIPPQARRMYLAQRVRVIADTHYIPVPMIAAQDPPGAALPDAYSPIDMTFCALRSVSPIHVEYLMNMGVRSSIGVSLTGAGGELWGMLVCHDEEPRLVPAEVRSLVDLFGQVLSVLLASICESEAMAERLSRERHLRSIATALSKLERPLTDALAEVTPDLLSSVAAFGAIMRIDGKLSRYGNVPSDDVALAAFSTFDRRTGAGATATDELGRTIACAQGHLETAAGALILQLPHGIDDAIAWFRPEQAATVTWGGDPALIPSRNKTTGRLSPRQSFAAWREEVRGRSAAWTEADLAAAAEVRRLLGDAFIRRVEAEIAVMRDRDPLTGLVNRRLLQERLDMLRTDLGAGVALVYIDLDRFKDVNDTLGHHAGDILLAELARRLTLHGGKDRLIARIGGDEFAVLCEDVTPEEGDSIAEQIRRSIAAPIDLLGRIYHATASVGVGHSSRIGRTEPLQGSRGGGAALLQAADTAMYAAKRDGGNRAARYAEPLMLAAAKRFSLEQDLRSSLLAGGMGLSLVYQPMVCVRTGCLIGFEALARWNHPERGAVSPAEFVPLAETAGLMVALGDWVLDMALQHLGDWTQDSRRVGALPGNSPFLTVNVSPRQLSAGGFASRVAGALRERNLPAHLLQIEVTEGAMADRAEATELRTLRNLGVRVKIDDFGTGFSSLSYLRRLPADGVKLDRSFLPGAAVMERDLDGAGDPAKDEAFMAIIVQLAHLAGLDVIAEGIETSEQLDAATRAGVDAVQGFLTARPMPATAMRDLIAATYDGAPLPWSGLDGMVPCIADRPADELSPI
jgi:diguanylate cyclase (GGDEF)-like protein